MTESNCKFSSLDRISDPAEPADSGIGKKVGVTSLPDRPDLDQLRTQAKELKRALQAGEQAAIDRVLRSHPKLAKRPVVRIERLHSTLRDAQVTIPGELGFESWILLLRQVKGAPRWGWGT